MKIEIDEKYIQWIKNQDPELLGIINGNIKTTEEQLITSYINDVLLSHKDSWEELE